MFGAGVRWPLSCSIQIQNSWFWNPDTATARETHSCGLSDEPAADLCRIRAY
jgi:hypothetical protein